MISNRNVKTYREFNHEGVNDASKYCDKIKSVPGVFEVTLNIQNVRILDTFLPK